MSCWLCLSVWWVCTSALQHCHRPRAHAPTPPAGAPLAPLLTFCICARWPLPSRSAATDRVLMHYSDQLVPVIETPAGLFETARIVSSVSLL